MPLSQHNPATLTRSRIVFREPAVGDVIDRRYELRREIDRGGIGAVFEAYHLLTTRSVAIKMLTADHSSNSESHSRLLREAKALTMARHPNVVAVLDAGTTENDAPYLVMELIEGRTLSGILASRQRLGVSDTLQVGIQLCHALACVHERGIVHRDVKPSNLFLARNEIGEEVLKVFDFGVAALSHEAEVVAATAKLTQQGALLGTPEYMAPEQLLGRPPDPRSDIYSIGVTLYECLTGTVPFEGNFGEILLRASTERPRPVTAHCRDLPAALSAVIDRALSKDPGHRFPDARSLARALTEASDRPFGHSSLLGIRRVVPPPLPPEARPPRAPGGLTPPPLPAVVPRRRYARAPYVTPVSIARRDGLTIDGHSEDISEGGMLVLTEQPCNSDHTVTIRFALPGTGKLISVQASARWVRTARGTGAAGLEFQSLPEAARCAIRDYVAMMGGRI